MLPKPSVTVRLRAGLVCLALFFGLVVANPAPAEAAPKAPSGLTRASYSNNAVRLTWKAVKGAAAYQVKYASNSKLKKASYLTITAPVAEIGGLKAKKNYYFKVRALKADGKALTKYSKTKKIKTHSKKSYSALSPAAVNATNNFGDEVTINWGAQGTSNLYRLRWATKKSMKGAKSIYVTGTSQIVEGLKRGTPYYFNVTVVNTKKKAISQTSSVMKVTTAAKISFGTPTGVTLSRINPTDFTISWSAVRKAPAYQVAYADDWAEPNYLTVVGTSSVLGSLVANTDYQVKVRVLDALGQPAGEFSTVAAARTRSQDAELRVASHNVMCHSCESKSDDPTAIAEPWTTRRSAVVEHINEANPDVVALQEARQSKLKLGDATDLTKTQFQDLVERLGSNWKLTNSNRYPCANPNSDSCMDDPAAQVDNGASLGVRIAYNTDKVRLVKVGGVARQGSVRLPTAPLDGTQAPSLSPNPRYLSWAVLQQKSTGKKFFMVSVHFESRNDDDLKTTKNEADLGCGDTNTPICGKVREAQAQVTSERVAALNTDGLPVIVAGDFASSRSETGGNLPYATLMASGLQNPLGGTTTTVSDPPAGKRVNIAFNSVNQMERKARRWAPATETTYDASNNDKYNGAYNDYILTSPMYVSEFEQVVHVDQATGEFIGVIPSDHNLIRASLWLP